MPVEIKNIYFSQLELKKALALFSSRKAFYFEHDDIKKFEIVENSKLHISCELEESLAPNNSLFYSQSEIAAALILFCMECKIPLPKTGTKELQVNGDELSLVVKLEHKIIDEEDVFDIG